MKRKIVVTTGTRSEYGLLRPLLKEINSSKKLELYLIVTGMHLSKKYGKTIDEIKKNGFKIFKTFEMVPKDDSNYSMSVTLGNGITQFSKIFNNLKPDINVILGDRDEMLASTIAAYHMNIPNAHIHGGDRSKGGIDEYNRHAITKMSNIHFAVSQQSKKRILRMGEDPKFVFLTGSPSIDEIKSKAISDKKTLMEKYGINFSGKEILLVQHPVTTETKKSKIQIQNTLTAINKLNKITIAILPNSDPGRESIQKELKIFSKKNKKFYLFSSLPREDYLGMIKNSGVLVGNSSSGMIEASYFSTPVVNIGIRQQDRERGKNVINVEQVTSTLIYKAIVKALNFNNKSQIKQVYGNGNASKKIVKYLEKISLDEQLIQKQISY
jgi:GDP/UDP-N,N'-diacetylbacillosamine 2-epimerase (hydrolysing)